jgi:hypothetical protein
VALVVVLLSSTLLLALGGGLIMLATTESRIAATFRDGHAVLYASEAAIARALADIAMAGDLNDLFAGARLSTFVDGAPTGFRTFAGGTLDLVAATNEEGCGAPACTVAAMNAVTGDRPWGVNNPRWQPFAFGEMSALVPGSPPGLYVVVWVGDDPLETDGDPLQDAPGLLDPGHEVLLLRAAGYGPHGVRRRVEVTVVRSGTGIRVHSWRTLS